MMQNIEVLIVTVIFMVASIITGEYSVDGPSVACLAAVLSFYAASFPFACPWPVFYSAEPAFESSYHAYETSAASGAHFLFLPWYNHGYWA
jgi:hypothetical protein